MYTTKFRLAALGFATHKRKDNPFLKKTSPRTSKTVKNFKSYDRLSTPPFTDCAHTRAYLYMIVDVTV